MAARHAVGLRRTRDLADFIGEKNFSYGKLVRIENGTDDLGPGDALYIAKRLGLPASFFTAELHELGDITAGAAAAAEPVDVPRPNADGRARSGRRRRDSEDAVLPDDPLGVSGAESRPPGERRSTRSAAPATSDPAPKPSRRKPA
ncbi:MAG: helix-turn-helix transcriptional regulator [Patulibacter minatonensis]